MIYTKLSPLHNTSIIPVRTVREPSGLACSSRNKLLSKDQKVMASKIYEGLKLLEKKRKSEPRINCVSFLKDFYKKQNFIEIDYVSLEKISFFNENKKSVSNLIKNKSMVVMVAAKIGNVRLIDNLLIN